MFSSALGCQRKGVSSGKGDPTQHLQGIGVNQGALGAKPTRKDRLGVAPSNKFQRKQCRAEDQRTSCHDSTLLSDLRSVGRRSEERFEDTVERHRRKVEHQVGDECLSRRGILISPRQ